MKYNSTHRKLGFYVSNFGRILAVFGMVIAKSEQWILYSSIVLTVFLLIASTYKVFFAAKPVKNTQSTQEYPKIATSPRNRSPKRD